MRRDRRDNLPKAHSSRTGAKTQGTACSLPCAPFRFCLQCGVSYCARASDFAKLSSLSSEGRSTATTTVCLSAIRRLRARDLDVDARKLLSFTDNRQDASLQAGHFNDFVEIGLLRAALYKARGEGRRKGLRMTSCREQVALGAGRSPRAVRRESGRAIPGAERHAAGASAMSSAIASTAI